MGADEPTAVGMEVALLGLLRTGPAHGYELHQRLLHAEALGLVWHLKQGHLYALLAKLEAADLLDSSMAPQGIRPPRKVLRLTAAGEEVLALWLVAPVEHGRDFRLQFLAKLYFAREAGASTVRLLLERQRVACHQWIAELQRQVSALGPNRTYEQLVLQFRICQLQAIVPWLDECESLLAGALPR
jgi:DNA-binding PadR family transcriptional regulator